MPAANAAPEQNGLGPNNNAQKSAEKSADTMKRAPRPKESSLQGPPPSAAALDFDWDFLIESERRTEAVEIDELVFKDKIGRFVKQYNDNRYKESNQATYKKKYIGHKIETADFIKIPRPVRSVLISMAWNMGQNILTHSKFSQTDFVPQILANDWPALMNNLSNDRWVKEEQEDKSAEHRRREEGRYSQKHYKVD